MAFQQQLKTYIDRNNLNYKYEEKQIEEQQFKARVIIYNNDNNNDTTYEWTDSQISKKIAKNKAAKIVLIKLEIIKKENEEENNNENKNDNENIKDILIDIRNLLKILVDKTMSL